MVLTDGAVTDDIMTERDRWQSKGCQRWREKTDGIITTATIFELITNMTQLQ